MTNYTSSIKPGDSSSSAGQLQVNGSQADGNKNSRPSTNATPTIISTNHPSTFPNFSKLPAELRLMVYEEITNLPLFIKVSTGWRCESFDSSYLHTCNCEMSTEVWKAYKKTASSFYGKNGLTKFYYNPSSTTFFLTTDFIQILSRSSRPASNSPMMQIERIAISLGCTFSLRVTDVRHLENARYKDEQLNLLGHFENLKRITFIQFKSGDEEENRSGQETADELCDIKNYDPLGLYREWLLKKELAAIYEEHFPDRPVPIAELKYLGNPFRVLPGPGIDSTAALRNHIR